MNKKDIIKIRKFVSKILFLKSNLNLFKFILNILFYISKFLLFNLYLKIYFILMPKKKHQYINI